MKNYILILILGLFTISCTENLKSPLIEDDTTAPGPISNIRVENLPGASKITYTLPNDDDLLYVVATYTATNGEVKQTKSSVFKNHILLEGFAETEEVIVSLQTVDRSENYSSPVTARIHPLEAPIHEIFRSLKVKETWGGVHVNMFNELEDEYVLYTLVRDSLDTSTWVEFERSYTKAIEMDFYFRPFAPKPTEFAFFLTDKWGNSSDTLFANITPLFEVEFDKSLWKDANLPDDFNSPLYLPTYQLWTGTYGDKTYFFQNKNIPGITLPSWITIDLGREYRFGRFQIHHVNHADTWIYSSCTPRIFEIWVTNTPTTNWTDWVLLGRYESVKPSGTPVGTLTPEDRAKNLEGEEYEFPLLDGTFRYMRFVAIETWGRVNYFCALEFTLFGQPKE